MSGSRNWNFYRAVKTTCKVLRREKLLRIIHLGERGIVHISAVEILEWKYDVRFFCEMAGSS